VKLKDVSTFERGLTYTKSDEADVSDKVVLRATNVDLATGRLNLTELKYLRQSFEFPNAKLVKKDAILICTASGSKSHLGKVALIDADYGYAFGGFMGQLTPAENLDPKYFYFNLVSKKYLDFIDSLTDGANINNLKFSDLGNFEFPLPPLDEQKRIVAKLDEALGDVDRLLLKKSTVLKELDALYDQELIKVFKGLIDVEAHDEIANVTSRITNGYVGPIKDVYVDEGIPYLLARHIRNNELEFDGRTFISQEFNKKNSKSTLKTDDVLLVQSGHIGHSAVVDQRHVGHNCHALIVLTPIKQSIIGQYLSLFFTFCLAAGNFIDLRSGSTVPHLTCKEIRKMVIPVPLLEQQHAVVSRLRDFKANKDRLVANTAKDVEEIASLRSSILSAAFAGDF
jgi:type I restriction enzyme S subunit